MCVGEHELAARAGAVGLDVEDGELDEVGDASERVEWRAPVYLRRDVAGLQGLWIEQLERVADARADGERVYVAETASLFHRDADEIIFADWHDLEGEGVFEIRRTTVNIGRE